MGIIIVYTYIGYIFFKKNLKKKLSSILKYMS
jgi:hypothetical protein